MENKNRFNWVCDKGSRYKSDYKSSRAQGSREQLEWIKHQLEYASFAEKYKLRYDLKKGEIYEIDWGLNVNAEFSSRHYGVVLADSGPYNPLVMVCPLKTNHIGAHPRSDVDLGYVMELNSLHPTVAVVNQIRTIDKLRIYTRNAIGSKDNSDIENVDLNMTDHDSIPRLETRKLQLIIDSYITMMITGDADTKL